ncbi:MAG: HAD-IA family hydrolase [Gammaproteobacteria bacterium]|nr:HAD-IA family hydrolase [Gammaproteobacteria bacterium]
MAALKAVIASAGKQSNPVNTSAMPHYAGLLLDFGGVCLRLPMELHRTVERELGLPAQSLTWMGPVAPETDPLWRAIWAGELTEREYWDRRAAELSRATGHTLSARDYMRLCVNRAETQVIRAEAVTVIRRARAAGVKVGILTNDLAAFVGSEWKDQLSFFREVDAFTDVSFGTMKPQPEAYALGLKNLGTSAAATLFVDDQPRNVEGAARVGLAAIRFDVRQPASAWAMVESRLFDTQ